MILQYLLLLVELVILVYFFVQIELKKESTNRLVLYKNL